MSARAADGGRLAGRMPEPTYAVKRSTSRPGRVRRVGGAQQRRLRRVLVHGIPLRRRRQGVDACDESRAEARARPGGNDARGARVRRRRLRRVVPVRGTRRAATDQESRRVREGTNDRPRLADRVLLRRQGTPASGRGDGGTRRRRRAASRAWAAEPSRAIRRTPARCLRASSTTARSRHTRSSASSVTARSASTAGSSPRSVEPRS